MQKVQKMKIVRRFGLAALLAVLSMIGVTAGVYLAFCGCEIAHKDILPWLYPPPKADCDAASIAVAMVGGAIDSALAVIPPWFFLFMFFGTGLSFSFIGILILLVTSVVRCNSTSRHAAVQLLATFVMGLLAGIAYLACRDVDQWNTEQFIAFGGIAILAGLIALNEGRSHRTIRYIFSISAGIILLSYLPIVSYYGCKSAIHSSRVAKYTAEAKSVSTNIPVDKARNPSKSQQ